MTREEFLQKYGDVEVKFDYYYKYEFVYKGDVDGVPISVSTGGTADEIYSMDVGTNDTAKISNLMPFKGTCGEDEFFEIPGYY